MAKHGRRSAAGSLSVAGGVAMPVGGEKQRLGPIGVVRLLARGVPLFSGGCEEEWQRITTPVFPFVFVLFTCMGAAAMSAVGNGYYSIRYPGRMSDFLPGELIVMFVCTGLVQIVLVPWQYVTTAYLLRFPGYGEDEARRHSARVTYFSTIFHLMAVPCYVGWMVSGTSHTWGPSLRLVLLGASVLFFLLKMVTVFQGVRRCSMGTEGLGVAAALLCPEFVLALSYQLAGPICGGAPAILVFFAVPVVLALHLRKRYPDGHCQSCGYNLTGNVSGRCSECGAVISGDECVG